MRTIISGLNNLLLAFFILVSRKIERIPYFADGEYKDDTLEQVIARMQTDIYFLSIRAGDGGNSQVCGGTVDNCYVIRGTVVRIVMYCAVLYFKALNLEIESRTGDTIYIR